MFRSQDQLSDIPISTRIFSVVWVAVTCICVVLFTVQSGSAEEISYRIRVPLPVSNQAESVVRNDLRVFLERQKDQPNNELTLLLEFDTSNNLTGEGSSFESCLGLARYLQSPEFQSVRRIAYVPEPKGFSSSAGQLLNVKPKSQLGGHALLLALACDELWMDKQATLAGVGAESDAELLASNYTVIGRRGLQWPASLIQVLVDPNSGLYRVRKPDGSRVFVDDQGRRELSQDNQEVSSEELAGPGVPVLWSAENLASWNAIELPVLGREDLISRLPGTQLVNLSINAEAKEWKAARLMVTRLDDSFVSWSTRSIRSEILGDGTNLLFVSIDTLGAAEFRAAADFADLLISFDQDSVRTVALLPNGASGPETLVAMACDDIIMVEGEVIGGRQSLPVSDDGLLERLNALPAAMAARTGRDSSLIAALALGNVEISEYLNRQTGGKRLMSTEQWETLDNKQDWQKQEDIPVANGWAAQDALRKGIVTHVVEDTNTAKELYGLDQWKEVVPSIADRGIRRFANFLTSPVVASMLLMFGMFALFTELSSPGLGFPGFLGVCLLGLFFWSHHFDGSAEILEIALFILGLLLLLVEFFFVPGFGIFGIGGAFMLLAAIVLACQDFVLPRWDDPKQVNQMASSLMVLLAGMTGILGSIIFMRYYLERMPFLNRLMLEPPAADTAEQLDGEGSQSKYGHLRERAGVALTVLRPSGKAKFGAEIVDVITDGRLIEKDTAIRVYEVSGTSVKVEPADS